MNTATEKSFIDDGAIIDTLARATTDAVQVREVLGKARELKGLSIQDAAVLAGATDPELLKEMYSCARFVKETIYGRRLVLFAPLYISNLCSNDCLYCGFRSGSSAVKRRALNQPEIAQEVLELLKQGHKRVLLVAGESYPEEGFPYILRAIDTIYGVSDGRASIRRINANIAPLSVEEFHALHDRAIGTYQLFQETYHHETYKQVHRAGKKRDYHWRLFGMDRAMEAGINDVGIGALFGLYDWRFELLALLKHAEHLEGRFGVGPHTISVPRMEPATDAPLATNIPAPVSDEEFKRLVAILRMAVPYTGMILSTRESPDMRRDCFALGISQISAGSRTDPGGYSGGDSAAQFSLGDHRSLDEVIRDVASLGYIPSFCTACYRLGRTGRDFMDLAKPGLIKGHCDPNALSTFKEFLIDYASEETR
jgi:2-iminoacetate synthase